MPVLSGLLADDVVVEIPAGVVGVRDAASGGVLVSTAGLAMRQVVEADEELVRPLVALRVRGGRGRGISVGSGGGVEADGVDPDGVDQDGDDEGRMTWAPPSPFFWRRRQRPATGDDADGSRPEAQPSLRPHALLAAVFGPTMGREVAALASDSGCTDDEAVDRVAEVVDRLVVLRNAWVVDGPAGRDASADSDRARTMAVAVSDLARRVGVVPRRSWLSRRWRRASSDWDGAAQAADRLRLLQVGMVAAGVYGVSTFTEAHLVTVLRADGRGVRGRRRRGFGRVDGSGPVGRPGAGWGGSGTG